MPLGTRSTCLACHFENRSGKRGEEEGGTYANYVSPDHSSGVNTRQIFRNLWNSSQSGAETEPKTEAETETETEARNTLHNMGMFGFPQCMGYIYIRHHMYGSRFMRSGFQI